MFTSKENIIINLNIFALYAVLLGGVISFVWQFYYHELPCPLCVLQRLGLLLVAFGFMLNVKHGFKASHYGLCLLALLFMISAATRQVLLHIVPGSGSYGSAFLNMHLYSWVVIMGTIGIFYIAILLLFHQNNTAHIQLSQHAQKWANFAAYAIWVLVLLNVINTFMICGLGECSDNPTHYLFFS